METLQDTIESFVLSQQLEWEIQDMQASNRPWDDEYIYIFIGLLVAYIITSYLITTKKEKK